VIPLYFETKSNYHADYVVVAACTPENQFKRLTLREGYSSEEAERRIRAQIPVAEKIKMADYVIDTNQTLEEIKHDVKILLNDWKWDPYEKNS
jgi:dephospho-CoA kinase